MTDDALFGSARVRRARHVCPCIVVGSANPHGSSVLGRRHSADADERFNGAAVTAHPYINLLPHLCSHVVRGCSSLYSSTGDTHEAI